MRDTILFEQVFMPQKTFTWFVDKMFGYINILTAK